MKRCLCLVVVIAAGMCWQSGAGEKGKLGRAGEDLLQKAREEREAKRKKDADEQQKQREDQKQLRADPQAYYEQAVKEKYAAWNGKPVPFVKLEGNVLEILDETRILLSQEKTWYAPEEGRSHVATKRSVTLDPVIVVLTNTAGIAKATDFGSDALCETGTWEYPDPGGAKKTI